MQVERQQFNQPNLEHENQEWRTASLGFTKMFDDLIQPEENKFANEPPEQRKFKKRKRDLFYKRFCLYIPFSNQVTTTLYITVTAVGFVLIMTGGGLMSRIIKGKLNNDVFNKQNETFPQEERLSENEYSINLPAHTI